MKSSIYRDIVYRNVELPPRQKIPEKPTRRQIQILTSIVTRRRMSKEFLCFISEFLFDTCDFAAFNYQMMYEFIYVLAHYRTIRERSNDYE